jgi:hypothetical protein
MAYKDPEKLKAYNTAYKKAWREKNKEHALKMERARRKKHREKHRTASRRSYFKYREQNIERIVKSNRARYRDRRINCIEHYGNKCDCCGDGRIEFLAIDHINGGGLKHRKELSAKNMNIYEYLTKNNYPHGFRVLCHNCNASHGNYGYCPHQIERGELTMKQAKEIIEQLRLKRNETKKKSNTSASTEILQAIA